MGPADLGFRAPDRYRCDVREALPGTVGWQMLANCHDAGRTSCSPPSKNASPRGCLLVVRDDELDPAVLRADAKRFQRRFSAWGRYGVSAFLAADDAEIDALCETKLLQWATAVVFRRADLEAAGVDVVATFRTPHVTLACPKLSELVDHLVSCDHEVLINPYHEPDNGPEETR